MQEELMRRLRQVPPEEQHILDGGGVDQHAYTEKAVFTVDSEKMIERGRMISVRPHTRFAPFPRHSHSYIEIMYMCSGKTVHRIIGGIRSLCMPVSFCFWDAVLPMRSSVPIWKTSQ